MFKPQRVESRFSSRTGITASEPVPGRVDKAIAWIDVIWDDSAAMGAAEKTLTDDLVFRGKVNTDIRSYDEDPLTKDRQPYAEDVYFNAIRNLDGPIRERRASARAIMVAAVAGKAGLLDKAAV